MLSDEEEDICYFITVRLFVDVLTDNTIRVAMNNADLKDQRGAFI